MKTKQKNVRNKNNFTVRAEEIQGEEKQYLIDVLKRQESDVSGRNRATVRGEYNLKRCIAELYS